MLVFVFTLLIFLFNIISSLLEVVSVSYCVTSHTKSQWLEAINIDCVHESVGWLGNSADLSEPQLTVLGLTHEGVSAEDNNGTG